MPRYLCLAALAATSTLLAFGEPPTEQPLSPSIGVYLDFDSQPGEMPVEIMKKEVGDLLKSSGVTLDWRLARENTGHEAFSGLVVLRFRGHCKVENWSQPGSDFGTLGEIRALGSTKVAHGRVLPFSEVECDQVQKALAYLQPGTNEQERQQALGLALGRVVAHELYHMLARTTAHATEGLAKAAQSLKDLVAPGELIFQQAELQAIRKGFQAKK